ncbi:MAG: TetR/AcrR family transcriptional regulator [Acidobacteriota bacterium]
MPTPRKFTEENIIDAALRLASELGPAAVTVGAIAGDLQAPIGSIYHRFKSRDVLLGEAWLRTVEDFQAGFLKALNEPDTDSAGLQAALYTPRWVRKYPTQARILLLYRREDFYSNGWSAGMAERAERLGSELHNGLQEFARHYLGSAEKRNMQKLAFAIVDLPYAAVRRYVAKGEKPPLLVDEMVRIAYLAIM